MSLSEKYRPILTILTRVLSLLRLIEWCVVKETQSLKRYVYEAVMPYYVLISSHHDRERYLYSAIIINTLSISLGHTNDILV